MSAYQKLCQSAISEVTLAAKRAAANTDGFTSYHLAYTIFRKNLDEAIERTKKEMKEFVLKSNVDLFNSKGLFWNEVSKEWKTEARREYDRRKRLARGASDEPGD